MKDQTTSPRSRLNDLHHESGIPLRDGHPATFLLIGPGRREVVDVADHLTQIVIRVEILGHPERDGVDCHGGNAGLAEEGVRRGAEPLDGVVLQESMGDDHVGADQLLAPGKSDDGRPSNGARRL
jgi:hypothetical protein